MCSNIAHVYQAWSQQSSSGLHVLLSYNILAYDIYSYFSRTMSPTSMLLFNLILLLLVSTTYRLSSAEVGKVEPTGVNLGYKYLNTLLFVCLSVHQYMIGH